MNVHDDIGNPSSIPDLASSLPKGGGAIRGIGEKFSVNPVVGTGQMSIPLATSSGRSGFQPQLSLSYNSGAGNSPFGFGWSLSLPSITRKTDKKLPTYLDADDSDTFLFSSAEDLVPDQSFEEDRTIPGYIIRRYRPRIEGSFIRIERWTRISDGDVHWRSLSRDNVLTVFGKDDNSRIYTPAENGKSPKRIFSWFISESRDDKGNVIVYEYKSEDGTGVNLGNAHERNRGHQGDSKRKVNRYLKRIRYGNRISLLDSKGKRSHFLTSKQVEQADWMFETVFDYGEHHETAPTPAEDRPWDLRQDPFSSYRAGFEVRTYRLCKRVLMFHHFEQEAGVGKDCLVRSTDFSYQVGQDAKAVPGSGYSFLSAVSQTAYKRDQETYLRKSLPPVEFEYSKPVVCDQVKTVDPESLLHLPEGVNERSYQWIDLHGEGVPGILTEQGGSWFYKRNLTPNSVKSVEFAPAEAVKVKPNLSIASNDVVFTDINGDGKKEWVSLDGSMAGMYEHDHEEDWKPFQPFQSPLNRNLNSLNVKLIDLDGDGLADVLITEQDAIVWHPSLGEQGFGAARKLPQPWDEPGQRLVFADATQTIFLADMSGDGLTDLVRVRREEVCYWPNLGYGHFGAKVTMDDAPHLDSADQFDPRRIRLVDVDGTGTSDLIYLHRDGVRLYFNHSGNRWSALQPLHIFPKTDELASITAVDLFGNGTACLVWSSALPNDSGRQMRYVDLMGGQKPHLLVSSRNNMGAESFIHYAPSTKFYLADQQAGKPWVTRLPFPVHVVEKVETIDYISSTRFATRYAYHHGYYDGKEREFRGFGMVEQWDTETYDQFLEAVARIEGIQETARECYQPPVFSRTWYHTGAYIQQDRILQQYREEYYQKTSFLPTPTYAGNLHHEEIVEGVRALKGLKLRQEIYSLDGSAEENHPYTVTEHTYEIRKLQSKGENKHAVFQALGKESITIHYERNPDDPRISHNLQLEADAYGNATKSCTVVYGRKREDLTLPSEITRDQHKHYITYAEAKFTPVIDTAAAYRLPTIYESKSYEISGVAQPQGFMQLEQLKEKTDEAVEIDYDAFATDGKTEKRLLSHKRAVFLDNRLKPLPLGQWDTLGLPYQSFQLAITPAVYEEYYADRIKEEMLAKAGYVHFFDDHNWWIPSGTLIYASDAAEHFYIPAGSRNALGLETMIQMDAYDLLPERVYTKQAMWNETSVVNDYRILSPYEMTDPNHNRTAVETDVLGLVVKYAVMGKEGAGEGDTLDDPTQKMEYDLYRWMNERKPNVIHTTAREHHGSDNEGWQHSYTYLNGSGGVAMTKKQAHPGKALIVYVAGEVEEVQTNSRWIGNGRTIYNNKGSVVKQYEPYFSTTHEYEEESALRQTGVTPIYYYDALGRHVRTTMPDGTLTRTTFQAWKTQGFDANDTVVESPWYAERGSPDPSAEPEPMNDPERRAAWLAAKHSQTPGTVHFDSLGRPVYAVSEDGNGNLIGVRTESDLTGRFTKVFDPLGREAAVNFVAMTGVPIFGKSAEKGERWIFSNAAGQVLLTWDEYGRQFRTEYDALQRPVNIKLTEKDQGEVTIQYIVYGDQHPEAVQRNLIGTAHQVYDQAGMMSVEQVDFKGNPCQMDRILASDYRKQIDWGELITQTDYESIQQAANASLEIDEAFQAKAAYDALNRPVTVTFPDGTIVQPTYNEAGFVSSIQAQIQGKSEFVSFLKEQDYDAKGQRLFAHYGNDVYTRCFYDENNFRLKRLLTYKGDHDSNHGALQHFEYTYDPVGNITRVYDQAQETHFFRNTIVKAENLYEYNAIYQLTRATGREHAGGGNNTVRNHADFDFIPQLPYANEAGAVRNYTQQYEYDLLGNITEVRHRYVAQTGTGGGWTRQYTYEYELDPDCHTNRLRATNAPSDPDGSSNSKQYDYDDYGNMIRMPHIAEMDWNAMDQLQTVDLGGDERAYYIYGADGQRIRKVIERGKNQLLEWIYLGTVQVFRRRRRDTKSLRFERWTAYLHGQTGLIAQVDTKTIDEDGKDLTNPLDQPLIRYQYGNHLGSAVLETDETGQPISYEEYHPYGTTAYRLAKPGFDMSLKRYRFSGQERDDETGLHYVGARYYAPWLGRWTSTDPAGYADGLNMYAYCRGNPVMFQDPTGTSSVGIGIGKAGELDEDADLIDLQIYALKRGYIYVDPKNERRFVMVDEEANIGRWEGGNLHRLPEEDLERAKEIAQEWEFQRLIDTIRSLDIGGGSALPEAEPEPEQDEETVPEPTLVATTDALQEAARPRSESGKRPRGTLHLWSGKEGKQAALDAIKNDGSGWMMGNIDGEPTPQHAKAEVEYNNAMTRERLKNPGEPPSLSQGEFDRIWGRSSAEVVGRGAFAGHPVEGHGPTSTTFGQPGYVQGRWETPARIIGGGAAGAFGFGTGMFGAITGAQDPNTLVAVGSVLAGVGEATSGIIYGAGAFGGSAQSMAIGAAGGTLFTGAGAAIGFGVASYRSYKQGDALGSIVNGLGAIGGALMIASLFTPVGWVGLLGVGLVTLAAGFNLYRWFTK